MQKTENQNAPYGLEFSDIPDDDLFHATQEAEKEEAKRFGQPVTTEALVKSSAGIYYFILFWLYVYLLI